MTGGDPNDLVQRIAVGDVDASAPEVRAALAADPELARRVDEVLALQRALSAAGRMEREVLGEALRGDAPPRADTPRSRTRRWPALLAALVVVTAALLLGPWPRPSGDGKLGTAPRIESLTRHVDGSLWLRWSGSLRPGDYYAAALRRPTDGSEIAHTDARLLESEWKLPPLTDPPAAVRAEVEILDATGQRVSIARGDFAVPR